ncbi:hypothetical protein HKD37_18G051893 [Glycine soja]
MGQGHQMSSSEPIERSKFYPSRYLGYLHDNFSRKPPLFSHCSLLQQLLPTISALVQLPAVVSGDCIGKEEEKEGDCVRISIGSLSLLHSCKVSHSSLSWNSFSLCIILKKVSVTSKILYSV